MNGWNVLISRFPGAHILQTAEWGSLKARFGWEPHFLTWRKPAGSETIALSHQNLAKVSETGSLPPAVEVCAAALFLVRQVRYRGFSLPISIAYTPKGPLLDWENPALRARVLEDLAKFARSRQALLLKMDPDVRIGTGEPGNPDAASAPAGQAVRDDLQTRGWKFSPEQIQFRNTIIIDLSPDEDELLSRMKQKTRYNIRLAGRKGVTVRPGGREDIPTLFQLYAGTAIRDGFVIREAGYYREVWETYFDASWIGDPHRPSALPLIAEVEGLPVAAVVIFRFGRRAWFLYGMSSDQHRDKMPNYLLQWEAIKRAKAAGCLAYDMWGAPDDFNPEDPLWGVYRFKDGFQGTVVRTIGAWDLPIRPALHRLYSRTLPALLALLRRKGKARARQLSDTF